jgi:transposase, IS6 family
MSRQTVVMRTRHPRPATVPRSAFAGFCFPPDVIVLAVRWYLRFGLSFRDVEELLAERGVEVDHVTVYRWVQRFSGSRRYSPRPPGPAGTPSGTAGTWMRPT